MGVGYYSNVTQWSKGEYQNASMFQDDLQIIANKLLYRSDDHEDIDLNSATALGIIGTSVSATNPVNDPGNSNPANKGIIEDQADVDLFYFEVGAGPVDLTITPAWIDHYWVRPNPADQLRGTNIDIKATLSDEFGTEIISSNPLDDTYAQINTSVDGGRYILTIEGVGVGNPLNTGYTNYGSLGQYFINGSVPDNVTTTAPPPIPTGLSAVLLGDNTIDLSWTDPASTPENNESGYNILRQDNDGSYAGIASIAANSTSYSDNNLASGTYSYQVEASNSQGSTASNTTTSIEVSVPVVPTLAFASSESNTSGSIQIGSYVSSTTLSGYEELIEQHQGGRPQNRVSQLIHTWNVTGVDAGASVILEVTALAPSNNENDDFDFHYSINGGSYVKFGTLQHGTASQTMSVTLPTDTAGLVSIRVNDTDRTRGRGQRDTVQVSYIVVTSTGDAGDAPPVVTITNPSDTQIFETGTTIQFSASALDDNDGDVSGSIQWSSNLDAAIGAGANLSRSDLSVGTHLITTEAQDSIPSTGSDSITITINPPAGNNPPVVTITSPANNLSFEQGTSVTFTGTANDAEDDDISSSISWTSSLDGLLGSGASIGSSSLSVGSHSITASATDSGASPDSDNINLTITAPPGSITLQGAANKVKGKHTPLLTWSGASGQNVDIYRDLVVIATTANEGSYSDATGNKGGRTYIYQVCEAGTASCSAEVTVVY